MQLACLEVNVHITASFSHAYLRINTGTHMCQAHEVQYLIWISLLYAILPCAATRTQRVDNIPRAIRDFAAMQL